MTFACTRYAQGIAPEGEVIPERYVCYRAAHAPAIDGRLDELSWEKAPWTTYFADIEGDLKPRPRFKTRAKMLWDDEYFYVAAEMEEPHLWATVTQRDVPVLANHDFEVFIDPDGDGHEYYEMEMNACNTVWDLLLVKPYRDLGPVAPLSGDGSLSPAVTAWDIAGLKTAVHLRGTLNQNDDVDEGWSVEIAFPWRILRECAHRPAPPSAGDQWRVNFSRVEHHLEKVGASYQSAAGKPVDNWVWSPHRILNMHYPELWGYVQFSAKVAGEGKDEFVVLPEEEAQRALYKIYYSEKGYYREHGRFTDRLEELVVGQPALSHYRWPPRIQVTDSLFEASIEEREDFDRDGRQARWHIRQDAKVWKTEHP
ncbi:MAG: carbohydrate-binding family 9-like protein [Candidatus Latescibacteria bacterium]|nr:carbohydrate-binding family 9-like protein [Candidatus Latescibacterota bacterium]